MKKPAILTIAAVGLVLALVAADAQGQYYTPLRYDLRQSSPTYIPSGAIRFGPDRQPDPYAFGSPQYGNLGMTGNLRLGKSFQGRTPYRPSGSQLSSDLPSLRLSDFRRDSIGIDDVGTGVEYGRPGAYFPGSGSVTTPWSAGGRFTTPLPGDRAPYSPRDVNAPVLPRVPAAGNAYSAAGGPADAQGIPLTGMGLTIPRSALDYVDALIDGRASPMPVEINNPLIRPGDESAGRYGPLDPRIGSPAAGPRAGEDPNAPDAQADPNSPTSALHWLNGTEPGTTAWDADGTLPPTIRLAPPAAGAAAEDETPGMGTGEAPPLQAAPSPYVPVSPYATYVERGHEAVRARAFDKAEALYAAGVALEPDRPGAFFGRIHALLGGRMYLQAILVLERELNRHPDWVKAVPDLKAVYDKPEVCDRILTDIKRELFTKPNNQGFNFLAGYVLLARGEGKAAKPFFEKAADADREDAATEKAFLKIIEDAKGQ
ncbi:MAG: hypothetical protein IMZ66_01285 [Planctomycetes bacterium]|nr:hypothetical protein [Planctomycetota bacterium]